MECASGAHETKGLRIPAITSRGQSPLREGLPRTEQYSGWYAGEISFATQGRSNEIFSHCSRRDIIASVRKSSQFTPYLRSGYGFSRLRFDRHAFRCSESITD